jgi:N-acetylmuramoyl-L-alanine amidase
MPPGFARERVLCSRGIGSALTSAEIYRRYNVAMLALLAAVALGAPAPVAAAPAQAAEELRPPIVQRPIPFGAARRRETAAYARRHYGLDTFRLRDPRVIVQHLTVNDSIDATYDAFAPDRPDVELHELPGVCAHFVVGRDGTIVQFVPMSIMCRHTVGLNWTALGVEHVGRRDAEVLGNRRQLRASLRLTRWLRCRFGIAIRDVIGHNESLRSRFHRERVARLRRQTHGDWVAASMRRYRARLRALECPAGTPSSAASRRVRDTRR